MAQLSAFADEVTDDFLSQVKYLASENVGHIELRFLNKKNVVNLSKGELAEAGNILSDYGLGVSAIGSPIGKVRLDEPFAQHLDMFKRAVDSALFFGTRFIRVFSYYAPEGKDIADYRNEVLGRFGAKVEAIEDVDIVMVHENETNIYGYSSEHCVDLVKTIDSPKLRLVYDPGNFVWGQGIVDNIKTCWPKMKPYVVHVHIKDWKLGSDVGSIPGQGDGRINELLQELAHCEYDGFLTMEPHLQAGGKFGGKTGPELFSGATRAVRKIAAEVGLELT
ncbi:MAG: sugar phosphate isomerase/epimerase [Planctomycetota bacterium]|nr:MAG: sugar phosphate isomerase/epimerase [Planctomycetota bacterium]